MQPTTYTHTNEPVLLSVLLRMLPPFLMLPLPLRSLLPPLPLPPPPPLVMLGSLGREGRRRWDLNMNLQCGASLEDFAEKTR